MFLNRRLTRIASRALLALLLLVQGMLAAHACINPPAMAAMAAQSPACPEHAQDQGSGPDSLCYLHCSVATQMVDRTEMPLVVPVTTPVLVVPAAFRAGHDYIQPLRLMPERPVDPPASVRFQVFRI